MSQSKLAMNTKGINYIYSLPSKYRSARVQEVIAANRDCFEVTLAEDESLKSVDRIVRLIEGLANACNRPHKGLKLVFSNRPGATLIPAKPAAVPVKHLVVPTEPIPNSPPRPCSPPAFEFSTSFLSPVSTPSSPVSLSLEWPSQPFDRPDEIFKFDLDDDDANSISGDGDMRLSFSSRSMHYDDGDNEGMGQGWTIR